MNFTRLASRNGHQREVKLRAPQALRAKWRLSGWSSVPPCGKPPARAVIRLAFSVLTTFFVAQLKAVESGGPPVDTTAPSSAVVVAAGTLQPEASAPERQGSVHASVDDRAVLAPTNRTSRRYFLDPFLRSGCPQSVRRFAVPSALYNQYSGAWVGGSVPLLGEARFPHEGTWGVDYDGLLRKPVWLHWTHGRRYQGGIEGYQTEGPRLLQHE
ncbi:MAG: hypothetical protein KatS3mg110_0806 [Pirellulaceae bacterium]|nr:MAG: hypothetical protein KatS3mg110_0806 [Pirellulaceae bacterium]